MITEVSAGLDNLKITGFVFNPFNEPLLAPRSLYIVCTVVICWNISFLLCSRFKKMLSNKQRHCFIT